MKLQLSQLPATSLGFLLVLCRVGALWAPAERLASDLLEVEPLQTKFEGLAEQPQTLKQKPRADPREYKHAVMQNGMEVLNVFDPRSTSVAVAVAVTVGSLADPDGFDGLAHLTEHAMFLGSTGYPVQAGLDGFLAMWGGNSNAYTAKDATVYHATLDAQGFDECLLRMADMFHRPLFNASWVWDEVSAVDSEHNKNMNDLQWRTARLLESIADERSPVHRFHTGNKATLQKASQQELENQLVDFFDANYCPPRMRLVTIGPVALGHQLHMSLQTFAKIPQKGRSGNCSPVAPSFASPEPYPEASLPKMLRVQGISTSPVLRLMFPMPNLQHWQRSHPAAYVHHILEYGGNMSLLVALRDHLGLAKDISTSKEYSSAGSIFEIEFNLLPEGVQKVGMILNVLFAFLENARQNSDDQKTVLLQTLRKEAQLDYDWGGLKELSDVAQDLAEQMTRMSRDDLMVADNLILEPSPSRVDAILKKLQPGNMVAALTDAAGAEYWKQPLKDVRSLPYYGTNFVVLSMDSFYPEWHQWALDADHGANKLLSLRQLVPGLHPSLNLVLPDKVQGLPEINELYDASAPLGSSQLGRIWGQSPQRLPLNAHGEFPLAELWFRKGWTLPVPKIFAKVSLRRPQRQDAEAAAPSAREEVEKKIGIRMLSDQMDVRLANLKEIGSSWKVEVEPHDFSISMSSFAPTARETFGRIVEELQHGVDTESINPQSFQHIVGDVKRRLQDKTSTILEVAVAQRALLLRPGGHSREELLGAWAGPSFTSQAAAQAVSSQHRGELSAVSLVMGSCSQEECGALQAELLRDLGVGSDSVSLVSADISERIKRVLRPAVPIELRAASPRGDKTGALLMSILLGVGTVENRVLFSLVEDVLQQVAFDELRTKLRLGYTATAKVGSVSNVLSVVCYVQSEVATPDESEAHCENVLTKHMPVALARLSDAEFHQLKESFKSTLLQWPLSPDEESKRFWQPILLGDCLDLDSEMLKFVDSVRKEDLLEAWRDAVMPDGRKSRTKVAVKLFASEKTGEGPSPEAVASQLHKLGAVPGVVQQVRKEREETLVLHGLASSSHRKQLLSLEGSTYFPQVLHCELEARQHQAPSHAQAAKGATSLTSAEVGKPAEALSPATKREATTPPDSFLRKQRVLPKDPVNEQRTLKGNLVL